MRSLFDPEAFNEIKSRLDLLSPQSKAQWGRMDVAQMLKHVKTTMMIATGEVVLKTPPWHRKLLFRLFRATLYNDRPWRQNLPTARELRMKDPEDFATQKQGLLQSMDDFLALEFPGGKKHHPAFGTCTKEQWGKMQYKHLDHHFRQFGV